MSTAQTTVGACTVSLQLVHDSALIGFSLGEHLAYVVAIKGGPTWSDMVRCPVLTSVRRPSRRDEVSSMVSAYVLLVAEWAALRPVGLACRLF